TAAATLLPFLYYNVHFFHSLWGGYGAIGLGGPHPFYRHPALPGVAGLLVSPAKGLFVFSPFLVFLAAARGIDQGSGNRLLALCLAVAVVIQILLYARTDWRAGACYGPRFLADALPAVFWLLAGAMKGVGRTGWTVLAGLIVVSIAIQGVG